MLTIFEEFDLTEMLPVDAALRDGVLYDMLGRAHQSDVRESTVEQFGRRYHVDQAQADRVLSLALHFFDQIHAPATSEFERTLIASSRQRVAWAGGAGKIGSRPTRQVKQACHGHRHRRGFCPGSTVYPTRCPALSQSARRLDQKIYAVPGDERR